MLKLILFCMVIIGAATPMLSEQISCYECKSHKYQSSRPEYNGNFAICDEDPKKWRIRNETRLNFIMCKKLVEKVNVEAKEETLTIRTIGIMDMGLGPSFTEYSCDTDLCNSAMTLHATAFAVVLSIAATLTAHL